MGWICDRSKAIYVALAGVAGMTLLPPGEYAQFSGGTNVFAYGGLVVGNYLLGAWMDRLGSRYELAFVWRAVMSAAALVPLGLVYRGWRQHGGPDHYAAPLPVAG